ncbi:hypothetical protein M3Y94_00836800 [Aphelenchoides besseyi]|nr:hypothetical protein M3Y94_00836800 [Aphelenchoides besseyi]KAI6226961.1 hypothetical protein M3Y95_00676500 [Aphelenchoides besseyi]
MANKRKPSHHKGKQKTKAHKTSTSHLKARKRHKSPDTRRSRSPDRTSKSKDYQPGRLRPKNQQSNAPKFKTAAVAPSKSTEEPRLVALPSPVKGANTKTFGSGSNEQQQKYKTASRGTSFDVTGTRSTETRTHGRFGLTGSTDHTPQSFDRDSPAKMINERRCRFLDNPFGALFLPPSTLHKVVTALPVDPNENLETCRS